MRTGRRSGAALLVVIAVVAGLLASCSTDSTDLPVGARSGLVTFVEAQRLLDTRAAAILSGDRATFLSTLDRSNRALLKRQRRFYANMQDLPVGTLTYTVMTADWPTPLRSDDWGEDVSLPQVRVATQLDGFDTVPVNRVTGFAFGRVDGLPVILSELTGAGTQFPGSRPAPWDLVRVRVQAEGQTLQIFDDGTKQSAALIGSVVRSAVADVSEGLPFSWDGQVVVYVFSRKVVLDSFEGVPGGNINHLGAMTFPVYAEQGQPTIAGTRFTLLPSSVAAGQPFLDRITRHEMTHVAVGESDDGAPVWFAEGLAEYMGARSIRKADRKIATVAVQRARSEVTSMPASATFNGKDQAWHYALSWMACDYIAATQGESKLWDLMDAFHNLGLGTPDEEQDAVLLRLLGMDAFQLAQATGRRILRIYDKDDSPSLSPPQSPPASLEPVLPAT